MKISVGSDEGEFLFDFFSNSELCIYRVYLKAHRVEFEAKMFSVSQCLLSLCFIFRYSKEKFYKPILQFVKLSFC